VANFDTPLGTLEFSSFSQQQPQQQIIDKVGNECHNHNNPRSAFSTEKMQHIVNKNANDVDRDGSLSLL